MSDTSIYLSLVMSGATGLATFFGIVLAYFYLFRPNWRSGTDSQLAQQTPTKNKSESDSKGQDIGSDSKDACSQDENAGENESSYTPEDVDPVVYASHIPSEIKKAQQKVMTKQIEEKMSTEDKEKEKQIQRDQLEAIFKLMQQQDDKFGIEDFGQMNDQMKYYK